MYAQTTAPEGWERPMSPSKPVEPERRPPVIQTYDYTPPESTKPVAVETMSYRMDYNRNPINESQEPKDENNGINNSRDRDHRNDSKRQNHFKTNSNHNNNTSNPWDSDLLRHVLDGGLQGLSKRKANFFDINYHKLIPNCRRDRKVRTDITRNSKVVFPETKR